MLANKKGPAIYSNNDGEQGTFRRGCGLVCACSRLTSTARLFFPPRTCHPQTVKGRAQSSARS